MRYKLRLNKTLSNSFFSSFSNISPFSNANEVCNYETPDNICLISILEIKISDDYSVKFETRCMISNIMSLTFKVLFDKLIEINKYGVPVYGIASSLEHVIFEMNIGGLNFKILREYSDIYFTILSSNCELKIKYSELISTMIISIILDYVHFTFSILKIQDANPFLDETNEMLEMKLKNFKYEKLKSEIIPNDSHNTSFFKIFNRNLNEEHTYEIEVYRVNLITEIENKIQILIPEHINYEKERIEERIEREEREERSVFSFNVSSISSSTL